MTEQPKRDGLSAVASDNWSPCPGKETKQEWRCCATPERAPVPDTFQESTRSKTAPSSVCSAHAHRAASPRVLTLQGRFLLGDSQKILSEKKTKINLASARKS